MPLTDVAALLPEGDAFLRAVAGPFRRAIRLHPRRGSPHGWRELSPIPWSSAGRFHAADQDPGGMLDYHTGTIYPQDAASQLPALLLAARPGEIVVDACAAPGSKSTQLGHDLGDDGLLVCCDRSDPRRRVLVENLARQGVACAVVTPVQPEQLAERHPQAADAVLLDAPCSGHEDRSPKQRVRMAERQLALLVSAARLTRAGGRVVYSTCTPYREEDEDVVARFLDAHAGWSLEPVTIPGLDADLDGRGAARLWPHRQATEPFFACRLRAPGDGEAAGFHGVLPPVDRALARWLPTTSLHAWRRGDRLLAASPQAAACALPSEARGVMVARATNQDWRLDPWGAQALIERGADGAHVERTVACILWAGGTAEGIAAGTLVATADGAPLGVMGGDGRLDLPSRMFRSVG